jgi:hypothetical protein
MAAAPLRLVYTTAGDLEVSLPSDPLARFEAMPLVGDFRSGVDGYDVVGGNALLPVRRPIPDMTVSLVGQTAAVSANLPGLNGDRLSASATLSGLASASVVAALAAPTPTSAPGATLAAAVAAPGQAPVGVTADTTAAYPTAAMTAAGAGVTAGIPNGAPALDVTAPLVNVAVAAPVAAAPTLTVQGPVLDASTVAPAVTAATSLGGAAVNSLLDTLRRFP